MSSLRVETLRLCWLEAFIAVVEEEDISEAARRLDLDQSTVSRYMQALEKWLGKKLIDPGAVRDPEDARISIGVTEDGREFFPVAADVVNGLTRFRHESAIRAEVLAAMDHIISSMEKDRKRRVLLPVTVQVNDKVTMFRKFLSEVAEILPLADLRLLQRNLRSFFNHYEWERNKEKRRSRRKSTPAPSIPADWFEENCRQYSAALSTNLSDSEQCDEP